MNMKFIAGISLMSIAAASFWACGEGEIYESNDEDYMFGLREPDEWVSLKDQALESCAKDETCSAMYADYLANPNADPVEETPASSANQGGQTGTQTSSSSIGGGSDIVISDYSSSSSITFADPDPVTPSSSSEAIIVEGLGYCKPMTTPIDKNTAVAWQFVPNPELPKDMTMKFATGQYVWDFGGLPDDGSATSRTSGKVTYTTSGKVTTTKVTVTLSDGQTETKTCEPLQVNGDPITGCKCEPDAKGSVNFQKTPSVTWSVTGCTSLSEVNSWTWNGTPGTDSFSNTFTAATASYAPTLKVGNSDNTEIDVQCTPVKVTEGEEFSIKSAQDKVVFKESGSFAISANLPDGWHNSDTECNVFCNAGSSNFTVEIDGITLSGKTTGMTYVSKGGLLVAHTVGGYTMPVTVEIAAGDSVACGVNW